MVLAAVGLVIHFLGARVVNAVLPPAITGAVVMLIGFNLAPVVATIYWPQDQWVALLTMSFVLICSLVLRGFWARISILLGLVFGYLLSWLFDKAVRPDPLDHRQQRRQAASTTSAPTSAASRPPTGSGSRTSPRRTSASTSRCWCCPP